MRMQLDDSDYPHLHRVMTFGGNYQYNGNSYLAIYGWTRSPLIGELASAGASLLSGLTVIFRVLHRRELWYVWSTLLGPSRAKTILQDPTILPPMPRERDR
jgi:Glycosyl hydrolases family 11